jgi:DNA-binding GntR family transcriptional regulator
MTMTDTAPATSVPPADRVTPRRRHHAGAADRAYAALRDEVLSGRLPLGVRLREDELASALRVSRTPVHEALLRLYGEGLLARHRDGGFTAVVPSLPVVCQLHELRNALERAGLDRPRVTGEPHDPVRVAAIRDHWQALADAPPSAERYVLEDERFHIEIAAASGNEQLARMLESLLLQVRAISSVGIDKGDEEIAADIADHLQMVDAVAAGDLDAARVAFDHHLDRSLELMPTRVASALVTMAIGR